MQDAFEFMPCSSLVKVFPDQRPEQTEAYTHANMLCNEVFSYQIAYRWDGEQRPTLAIPRVKTTLPGVTVRQVGLVPCDLPTYSHTDDNYLNYQPHLNPDPLFAVPPEGVRLYPGQWRSLWVSVEAGVAIPPGTYTIEITFEEGEQTLGSATFTLDVLPARLPEQTLLYTNWFHCDSLCMWYGVEPFSEDFWRITGDYAALAAKRGMNMILTPVFTPPLDTEIGGERLTVQLVDVALDNAQYSFGFDKLARWLQMCEQAGIEYFEISHLFTQWGAAHAPKVMATVDGQYRRLFGWETEAAGEPYAAFLRTFLRAFKAFMSAQGKLDKCYFHVSDEPAPHQLEQYQAAKAIIAPELEGLPIMDALSDYTFYESGAVALPIPSNNHFHDFHSNGVENLWTYYCCSQHDRVSNRFLAMPSARNRILGVQLYKFDVKGFLQWGYNFYYSRHSCHAINPYVTTSAEGAFPSGDPFVVYPGFDGPVESLRLQVFYDALQDMRALQALEVKLGRSAVLELIEQGLPQPITMFDYPKDDQWLLALRSRINALL